MLYMVIETFRNGDPVPVYRRFRDRGRLMPEGIEYRGSWVTDDLRRCFQVMECTDRRLLDEWMANWQDVRGRSCHDFGRRRYRSGPETVASHPLGENGLCPP
jgi:hypothetical protein